MKIWIFNLIFLVGTAEAQTGSFNIRQNDFKSLFNTVRVAQPEVVPWAGSFFPYSQHGTAVKTGPRSPMAAFDQLGGTGNQAETWELEHHTCKHLSATEKASCEGWWGHCNGWAAAAIKEREPRAPVTVGGQSLSVAEQKGILSEMWLSTNSLFAGESDKSAKVGNWVHDHANPTPAYRKFWDVTPKAFFLVFTNYVGLMKTGVVIDRFAGDEVWNQPIIGYRFLPIRPNDIRMVNDRGASYYSVFLRVKIYWANDLGTPPGHISALFDVFKNTNDSEAVERLPQASPIVPDYEGRLLAFRLMFDGPVTISPDGTQVLEAGQMIGDGIWDHQENSRRYSADGLNHTHPDFLWLPLNPVQDFNGYGNPHMSPNTVALIRNVGLPVPPPPAPARANNVPAGQGTRYRITINPAILKIESRDLRAVEQVLLRFLTAEGLRADVHMEEATVANQLIHVPITFPERLSREILITRLRGMPSFQGLE